MDEELRSLSRHRGSRPSSCAQAASCVRLAKPSLVRIRLTCTSTVLTDRNSCPAISRSLSPRATSVDLRSRPVRAGDVPTRQASSGCSSRPSSIASPSVSFRPRSDSFCAAAPLCGSVPAMRRAGAYLLRPMGLVDLFVRRRGARQHERGPRPAALGCEPGQGTHPDRDGEPVADVGDGGHALGERRLGASQVTALQAGHAEQLEGPGFDGGQAKRRGQLRAAFEPFDGDPEVVVESAAAPPSNRATARPASSPRSAAPAPAQRPPGPRPGRR